MTTTPAVWIGSLGLYNAGFLIGRWFDATDCPTEVNEWLADPEIAAQIGPKGPIFMQEVGEELWVFDHEGFGGLLKGECSPMDAQRVAKLIDDAATWDLTPEHLRSYSEFTSTPVEKLDEQTVRDAWVGEFEKAWHYWFDLAADIHGPALAALPDEIRLNIDWEGVAEAYDANGGGVYVDEIAHNRVFVWHSA